jgi:hypothetical protein
LSTTPSRSTFDPASVSRGTWVAAGGSLILLISVFLEWYHVDLGPISIGRSGWDESSLAKLVALLALVALVIIGLELFATTVALPYPSSLILIGIGALSALLVIIKMIDKPASQVSLSYGIFVSLIAAIAVAVGGYLKMQEG